jgi:hypothetical protein
VSSLVDHADRLPLDLARVKRALFHSRNITAATKRGLETHERWLHRHKLLWQEDLKQCQRLLKRQRVIWVSKRLASSLILVVPATCRALVRGAVWLVKCFGGLILIRPDRESGLRTLHQFQNRVRTLGQFYSRRRVRGLSGATGQARQNRYLRRYLCVDRIRPAMFGPVLGIVAITLLTVGVVRAAKPAAPSEVILAVLPEIQSPIRLAAVAPRKVPLGCAVMRGPSASAPPGFTLVTSVSSPEPLPLSGRDIIASTMLLMTPFPSPKVPPGFSILRSTEVPEAPPLSNTKIASIFLYTTPLVTPADVEATRRASAAPRPPVGEPEARPEPKLATQAELPRLSPKPKPKLATQKRQTWGFVPHSSW